MEISLPEHFEEFSDARRQGFLQIKELKEQGKTICGAFCQYTPQEIIEAAGMCMVSLCGQSDAPIKTAETRLPHQRHLPEGGGRHRGQRRRSGGL